MRTGRLNPKSTLGLTVRGIGALRWLALVGLVWGSAVAAAERPTIAALPLDFIWTQAGGQGGDAFLPQEATLREAYDEALALQSGVAFAQKKEVAAALSVLEKQDYAGSDATLAKAAFAAGTLYALSVSVRLAADGTLAATGRVVREDGMAMVGSSARVAWDSGRHQETGRELFLQLLAGLRLDQLPARLEVASPDAEFSPSTLPPTSMAPTERAKEARASEPSTLGVMGVTGGCTGLVGGTLMVALAPLGQRDANGHIIANVELAASTQRLQIAGVAFLGVGLVSLAVGIIAFVLEDKPVSAMFVPTAGGGAVVLVGSLW